MKSKNYSEVETRDTLTTVTGDESLDNFLSNGGGFVDGSAIFLTGTPGAGKTTFAIVLQRLLSAYKTALYSREMTASMVKTQMSRYSVAHNNAYIADKEICPTLNSFIEDLDEMLPKVVIVDSLQVIVREDYAGISADTSCFEIIQRLRSWTDKNNAVLIVIGHVNKDGEFEGRNTIQHMFDSHMEMVYDKRKKTRTISWAKNRFGDAGKVLFYEFGDESIVFYTQEQFDIIKHNKKLEDYVWETIVTFLGSLDKKNPNYTQFTQELKLKTLELYKSNKGLLEINITMLQTVASLTKRYGF